MRYKLFICICVLLVATPVLAQKFSPIVVETGKPTPSIVRSGESFKVTYRAKFFDTVLVYEGQMQSDNLALDKIEVIGLEISKERVSNDTLGFINIWDFTYVFRIIQPEKKVYKIPSFNFIWAEKKAGVTIDETKDKEKPKEMPTEEVGVGYVSTVVKPPSLDIRDEIDFSSPLPTGYKLRRWAYGVIGISLFVVVVILFRFAKFSKTLKPQEVGQEASIEIEKSMVVDTELLLSPKHARKTFLKELKQLQSEAQHPTLELYRKVRSAVRILLLAELRGTIRSSMSANEIYD